MSHQVLGEQFVGPRQEVKPVKLGNTHWLLRHDNNWQGPYASHEEALKARDTAR